MMEAINIMLGASILLSIWAGFSWTKVARARQVRRLDGRTVLERGDAAVAKQLLVMLVCVDALAATFAIIGWFN
jgi:hypothetical protein